MRIVHRIGLRASQAQQRQLEALGVRPPKGVVLPGGGDPLLAFDVDEEHPHWPKLEDLFQQWNVSDVLRTEFSKREVDSARWLEIGAWHHGYPQPEEDAFGYRQATYDLADWCEACGTGKRQKASFQMKGEPAWGRNGILQLTWVYDELFVTPQVWSGVFKERGVAFRPVMSTRGVELATVVQIVIEDEVGIVSGELSFERCAACARSKYSPVTRGPFPALTDEPPHAIARTREYFGSGGQADKCVLIAQDIARALATARVCGAVLRPVKAS